MPPLEGVSRSRCLAPPEAHIPIDVAHCTRPQSSPAAVGGPLLNPFGEVIGILGWSSTRSLHATKALIAYYFPATDITNGGIVREVAKDPNRQPLIPEGLEISSKEPSFAVFANWNPRTKIRQAIIQVALYDAANVRRAVGETKRANMPAGSVGRTIVTFAPTRLPPGPYRADILLAGRVVWGDSSPSLRSPCAPNPSSILAGFAV